MTNDLHVTALSPADLAEVEALRAMNNETLGFMAMSVMEGYLKKGGGLGIRGPDGLRGYSLYAVHRHHVRLIHLCVAQPYRGSRYAKQLVDAVVGAAKAARVGAVKLTCRRDYARASAFWPRYGFVPLAEIAAKTDDARLMIWYLGVAGAAQADIFSSVASTDKVKAAIDAQLFFQLHAPESADTAIAKGLQADFLADSLELYITMEMFNEIDRAGLNQRKLSRSIAHVFPKLSHDAERMPAVVKTLEAILPSDRPSGESDIRQLAMTATSNVTVFLTRDEGLLAKATQIKEVTSVDVLHPDELIVRLDRFADGHAYRPIPVSGSGLAWRRVEDDEVVRLRSRTDLLGPHERKRHFVDPLDEALSHPKVWRTEALWSENMLLALRSLRRGGGRLVAGLCRASRGHSQGLFTDYAAASLIHEAVSSGYCAVAVKPHGTTPEARDRLTRLGFVDVGGELVRTCPATIMSAADLRKMAPGELLSASPLELERLCSPVALQDGDADCLLVPIKPGYAQALFNTARAAEDLLGADEKVLLRWENVYFRKKSHHHMIRPPARILWYESGGQGVMAISHLDHVEIGQPKEVFRKNRSLGTLGWQQIYTMCGGSQVQEIMALRFSHSHLFRSPVALASLRRTYSRHGLKGPVLQSPSRVPRPAFLEIFLLGFPEQASP